MSFKREKPSAKKFSKKMSFAAMGLINPSIQEAIYKAICESSEEHPEAIFNIEKIDGGLLFKKDGKEAFTLKYKIEKPKTGVSVGVDIGA